MQLIKAMSTLEELLKKIDGNISPAGGLQEVRDQEFVILAQLHCLPSTVPLMKRLCSGDFGIKASNIIFVPKCYSTIDHSRRDIEQLGV